MPPAAAPPPAAPPTAAPAIRQDAAGALPPSQVSASSIAPPVEVTQPKPGSARERIFEEIGKKVKQEGTETETPPKPDPNKAETKPPVTGTKPGEEGTKPPITETKPGEIEEPDRTKGKPDKSFWKSYDAWKSRAASAEKALAEVKAGTVSEGERKTLTERATSAEKRLEQLEEHIRFVDYQQSTEFKEKYQQPYEKAWDRAMQEVGELKIIDPKTEQARPATANDLAALVNLPLGEARAVANALFGDFADDVMAYRKEIRGLWDVQSAALQDAKKNGLERVKKMTEQQQTARSELSTKIKETWDQTNQASLEDPNYGKYFKPAEGDQEGNQRLSKGFALVDRAFSESPTDPRLTPEQRASVVKRHAAVRNRAAAFGRLVYQLGQKEAQIAELQKKLDGYTESQPGSRGKPAGGGSPPARQSARDQVITAFGKYAK